MDEKELREGKARVQEHLIQPLVRLGLKRPSGMKVDGFEGMKAEMAGKLAYMTRPSLEALQEVVLQNADGKAKDCWPVAVHVLKWACDIQEPPISDSPLIRNVFGHQVGRDAVRGGYAVSLRASVKRFRKWPSDFVVSAAIRKGEAVRKRAAQIERRDHPSAEDAAWLMRYRQAVAECEALAAGDEEAA